MLNQIFHQHLNSCWDSQKNYNCVMRLCSVTLRQLTVPWDHSECKTNFLSTSLARKLCSVFCGILSASLPFSLWFIYRSEWSEYHFLITWYLYWSYSPSCMPWRLVLTSNTWCSCFLRQGQSFKDWSLSGAGARKTNQFIMLETCRLYGISAQEVIDLVRNQSLNHVLRKVRTIFLLLNLYL